jgi:uncharacterized membrane protein
MAGTTAITLLATLAAAAGFAYLGRNLRQDLKRVWPFVWLVTILIAVLYAAYGVWRHTQYESHALDLGLYDQAFWHLSRFETPASTVRGIANIFGDHFHPIIALLVPFYWIFSSPYVLIVGQAAVLALTLPTAFALGLKLKLNAWVSLIVASVIALNPGMVLAVSFDFHAVAFAPVLLLATALAVEARRWGWFWVAMLGLLLTKESVTVYAALLGATVALRNFLVTRRFGPAVRHSLAAVAVGVAAFFLVTRLVIPALSSGEGFVYWKQYQAVGETPAKLAWNVVAHPARTFGALVDTPDKRQTGKWMLATFGGLPLLSWTTWPLVLASFGERFWSSSVNLWPLQFHYQLMMVGVFGLAALYVLHDLGRWRRLRGLALGAAFVMVVMSGWVYAKLKPWEILVRPDVTNRPTAEWNAALRSIPKSAAVSAQDAFVPHLSHRNEIFLFPDVRGAEFIVLDPRAPSWPLTADAVREWQGRLRLDARWRLAGGAGNFTIFQRSMPNTENRAQ